MTNSLAWYESVEGDELRQGDFIPNCPIIVPPASMTVPDDGTRACNDLTNDLRVQAYDVVVMSQSCDLAERKLDLVLVCPHHPLSAMENTEDIAVRDFIRSRKGKEEMRRGYVPAYHMLAACGLQNFEREIQIVDFRTVFSVPFDLLTALAKKPGQRLRLLSPYREHLSQAFARFFMRVGLPANIPPFK